MLNFFAVLPVYHSAVAPANQILGAWGAQIRRHLTRGDIDIVGAAPSSGPRRFGGQGGDTVRAEGGRRGGGRRGSGVRLLGHAVRRHIAGARCVGGVHGFSRRGRGDRKQQYEKGGEKRQRGEREGGKGSGAKREGQEEGERERGEKKKRGRKERGRGVCLR